MRDATNDFFLILSFSFLQPFLFVKLFDRISSQVVSPSRAPPGDGINRCREAVDAVQSATSHKYSRDRAELVHLLGSPHIQVSEAFFALPSSPPDFFLSSHAAAHNWAYMRNDTAVNLTINNLPQPKWRQKWYKKMIYYSLRCATRALLFPFIRSSCFSFHLEREKCKK